MQHYDDERPDGLKQPHAPVVTSVYTLACETRDLLNKLFELVEDGVCPAAADLITGHDPDDLVDRVNQLEDEVRDYEQQLEHAAARFEDLEPAVDEAEHGALIAAALDSGDVETARYEAGWLLKARRVASA